MYETHFVCAINAKEIAVTFNQEMDKSTAEAAVTVEKAGVASALAGTNLLQSDKKTVIVTLAAAMTNKTGYDVKVAATAETLEGETLGKAYVSTFQFNDTVAPTVKAINVKEDGKVEVQFSEKLGVVPQFVVNGGAASAGTVVGTDDSKYTVTLPAGLKAGDTVSLIVSDAEDYAGNKMSIYSTSFKYDYTVNAPKVSKLAAKDEDTIELDFSKDVAALAAGTEVKVLLNGVALTATTDYTLTPVAGSNSKYTLDFTKTASNGLNKLYANNATEATVKVVVEHYKDTLTPANMGTKVEQNIVMKKDTVKPALKGSLVYKAAAGAVEGKLTANLTKKVAATTALQNDIYVLDTATGVKYPVTANVAAQANQLTIAGQIGAGDEAIVLSNGTAAAPALANGTYQLVIEAGAVEDQAFGKNKNDKIVSTFTVTGSSSTAKPEIDTVAYEVGSNDVIEVTYKTATVDVTATNAANYKLNGKALPTGTVITLNAAKTVATITLPEGSFAKTENQVFTIENVKSVHGVTMDKYEEVFQVNDNAKPELTGAKLVDGNIILTFSENVDTTTITTGFADTDFKVVLNGATLADSSGTAEYTVADADADATLAKNQVKIKPDASNGINFTTASTLTVEVVAGSTVADAAGNTVVSGPSTKLTIK